MSNCWSRRKFLGASVATVAMLARRNAFAADNRSQFGGFLVGIQSYTLRGFKIDDALKHMQDLGVGSVEFFRAHLDPAGSDEQIAAVKAKCDAADIKILAHGVNNFGKDKAANRRIFEFAKKAGIKNLSADPTEDSFDSLDELVKEFDIRIAIHNHGPGSRYNKVADVLTAIKGRDERIGACADLGHYIRSAEDPVKAIELFKGRLYGVHLKDFSDQTARAKGVILGKGHLDVEGVFRALRRVELPADACIALEYEENEKDPIADVKECFAVAQAAAQKSTS